MPIKSLEQATACQTRRQRAGKHGFARAVRAFVGKNYPDTYREVLDAMPHSWPEPDKHKPIEEMTDEPLED